MFGLDKSKKDVKVPDIFLKAMVDAPEDATVMCMTLFYSKPGVYNNARFTTWKDDNLEIVGDVKLPFTLLDGEVIEKYLDQTSSKYEARFYFRKYEHLLEDYLKRAETGEVDYTSKAQKALFDPKYIKKVNRQARR